MASCWEVAILGGDSDRSQQMQVLECSRSGGAEQQLTPALAHWHIRDHSSRQHGLTLTLGAHMALSLACSAHGRHPAAAAKNCWCSQAPTIPFYN